MFYNWNVIGHERALAQLETDFKNDDVHHAYLFAGPEKIGKFRVAKTAAAILQCKNNACHACPTCIQIEKKCHPDTIELEDDGESIKINTIKEIIARLNMTGQSNYKILLIQGIGRLTEEAANCLLKTLEEPLGKTIFIFTAGQIHGILPTITSRMRVIHFKKLPDAVLKRALHERNPNLDDETLNQIVSLSLGRSGKAIQLLSDPEEFQKLRDFYRNIQFLNEKASIATRIAAMRDLSQDPQKIKIFLSLLVHYLRQKLFAENTEIKKRKLVNVIEEIHKVINLLSRNINPRLLLENIMLKL